MRWRIWRWPLVIGVASAIGLVAALLGDGWLDALAWMGLGVPVIVAVIVAGFFMFRLRR
jgi:hypothetical protein